MKWWWRSVCNFGGRFVASHLIHDVAFRSIRWVVRWEIKWRVYDDPQREDKNESGYIRRSLSRFSFSEDVALQKEDSAKYEIWIGEGDGKLTFSENKFLLSYYMTQSETKNPSYPATPFAFFSLSNSVCIFGHFCNIGRCIIFLQHYN